jgi:uncharacterized membrane protein YdjX (TVP38/TMEM64 family)
MKKYWKKILLILAVFAVAIFAAKNAGEMITFEAFKANSSALAIYVERHYARSLMIFAVGHVSAAFFIPVTLILTLAGGFLFGGVPGALYGSLFSTFGATLAFLFARHLVGHWIQKKFENQLKTFNEEIHRHGLNYLLVLRVVPLMPAFVINYLSGLSRMSVRRFALITFLGMCPGAFVYSLAGSHLASLETPRDVLSGNVLLGFFLIVLLALLPVIHARLHRHDKNKDP